MIKYNYIYDLVFILKNLELLNIIIHFIVFKGSNLYYKSL